MFRLDIRAFYVGAVFCLMLIFAFWRVALSDVDEIESVPESLQRVPEPDRDQPDGGDKRYFNFTLPGGTEFCPIVMSATEKGAIVARVYHVGSRREIQVLEQKGGRWEFVGRNGSAITGFDGNFLMGAKRGPDGRLWLLAGYTEPSNPMLGERDILYGFENGAWKVMGPPRGRVSDPLLSDSGLHVLGTQPVHFFQDQQCHLIGLEGERWVPLAAEQLACGDDKYVVWRKDDAWVFWQREDEGRSTLVAYWLKGPRKEDISAPIRLGSWNDRVFLLDFAVSTENTMAVFGRIGDFNNHKGQFLRLYRQRPDRGIESSDLPFPPVADHTPQILDWSPRGILFAVTMTDVRTMVVHRFENGRWLACGDASQPVFHIYRPRLFFRDGGEPIVVWQNFLPH